MNSNIISLSFLTTQTKKSKLLNINNYSAKLLCIIYFNNFYNNKIKIIPKQIKNLINLSNFWINGNYLVSLSFRLVSLEYLCMDKN
jgi:hypothetical protein